MIEEKKILKFLVIGSIGAGKSSLIRYLTQNEDIGIGHGLES